MGNFYLPSFGMIAGFDRKCLGRYFSTTHLRVNLPTQRGEAGAPLLNLNGEVVGIVVSSLENNSACYALPIDAAEKIRGDFVRFGEARHGWIGQKAKYDDVRWMVERQFPGDVKRFNELHALIVHTGKNWCRPHDERCGECPLGRYLEEGR